MHYISHYPSPLVTILLAADEIGLTGLWFEGQKHFALHLDTPCTEKNIPLFDQTAHWLDVYFSGKEPSFSVPLHFIGTPFQKDVWNILCTIPYGRITTYGEIAKLIATKHKIDRMSAQAVGAAVGRNHISIIVPCHRVVGANGNLTGYAGGIDRKAALLALENADTQRVFMPHA